MLTGPILLSQLLAQSAGINGVRELVRRGQLGPAVLVGNLPTDTQQAWPQATPLAVFPDTPAMTQLGVSMEMACWPLRPRRLIGLLQSHLRVGRASTNDVILPHSSVSRLHAHMVTRMEEVVVMDCGSTQGTWVNGLKLAAEEPMPLRDRDRLTLGAVSVRFLRGTTLLELLAPSVRPAPAQG